MEIIGQPSIKGITIKKADKLVKFKATTGATLHTLVVTDLEKAHKLESSIKRKSPCRPQPSNDNLDVFSVDLNVKVNVIA